MATTSNAHTGEPGGRGDFPPFQVETFASQLLWLSLTFAFLYMLLAKVALPRISAILAGRKARITGDLAEAVGLKERSDKAAAACEKLLDNARRRAQSIADAQQRREDRSTERRRREIDKDANLRLEAVEKRIAAAKNVSLVNIHEIASAAAAAIVERMSGSSPTEKAVATAMTDAVNTRAN